MPKMTFREMEVFDPNAAAVAPPVDIRDLSRRFGDITAVDLGPETKSHHERNPLGIWYNLPRSATAPLTRVGELVKLSLPAWFLLPPILYFLLSGMVRMHRIKRTDPERWRKLTAFDCLKRRLRKARGHEEQFAAVTDYLAVRLDIQKAALSELEVVRALQRLNIKAEPSTFACLHELFYESDQARFSIHRTDGRTGMSGLQNWIQPGREVRNREPGHSCPDKTGSMPELDSELLLNALEKLEGEFTR